MGIQCSRIPLSQAVVAVIEIPFGSASPFRDQVVAGPCELPGQLAGPIGSLTRVSPRLPDLTGIVVDDEALRQLGKALFSTSGLGATGTPARAVTSQPV